jgi:soluble lytic murein transglycosylase-like protein
MRATYGPAGRLGTLAHLAIGIAAVSCVPLARGDTRAAPPASAPAAPAAAAAASDETPNPWLASRPERETALTSPVQVSELRGGGWSLRYRIAPGDTLGGIAHRLGVPLRVLAAANAIRDPRRIVAGHWLQVPSLLDEEGDAQITRVPDELRAYPHRLGLILSIARWAHEYDLEPDLLAALTWVESRWQSNALSEKQAMGLGQLIPETVAFTSDVLIGHSLDPWDPDQNLQMSARFLRYLLDQTRGRLDDALAAYYQGLGALRRDGCLPVTRPYVQQVQAARALFS